MSEKVYCKYCGKSSRDIQNVTGGSCPNSPSGGHVAYGGREQSKYYCMYCGKSSRDISNVAGGSCSSSPTKRHVPAV